MAKKGEDRLVLVVDDDPSILEVLEARLGSTGYSVLTADRAEAALEILGAEPVDLVVSDVRMPGMGGRGLLKEVLDKWPNVPVILLTAYGNIPDAVDSVQQGAADYLTKPFDGKELAAKVREVLARSGESGCFPCGEGGKDLIRSRILGRSPAMESLFSRLGRVGPADVSVLLLGESGTGKELAARVLHDLSPRKDAPFVTVDCGVTPEGLLESELFGHLKGSFTHALKDRKGLIEEAHGGTLFLDEIGNVSTQMQTRLLRFLQEGVIRRIGESREREVDCRVVAATNADLADLVRQGRFREDLYFRLKVVELRLPPLRERSGDVMPLAERFLAEAAKRHKRGGLDFSEEVREAMESYHWPGNVRELKNAVEAAAVLAQGDEVTLEDMQFEEAILAQATRSGPGDYSEGHAPQPGSDVHSPDEPVTLDEAERRAIVAALKSADWVQKNAAELLGISRRAIHYKINKYGIEIPARGERGEE